MRVDANRFHNIEQQHIRITEIFLDQLSNYLQNTHKFHLVNTKLVPRK